LALISELHDWSDESRTLELTVVRELSEIEVLNNQLLTQLQHSHRDELCILEDGRPPRFMHIGAATNYKMKFFQIIHFSIHPRLEALSPNRPRPHSEQPKWGLVSGKTI